MTRLKLHLLVREVGYQAQHAQLSWGSVQAALHHRIDPVWTDRVWAGLQSLSTAQANLSKLFYGAQGVPRRDYLIRLFEPVDLAPIEDRSMRNSFDHFDERLERWVDAQGVDFSVQDRAIASSIAVYPAPEQLRRFDPDADILTIRGRDGGVERFELRPMLDCIAGVQRKARDIDGAGYAALPEH